MFKVQVTGHTIKELKQNLLLYHGSLMCPSEKREEKLPEEKTATAIEKAPDIATVKDAPVHILPVAPTFPVEMKRESDFSYRTPDSNVDSKGTPWDVRIHAAGKSITSDGTWRRRRNVDDTEYERIYREIMGLPALEVKPIEPVPVAVPFTEAPPVIATAATQTVVQAAPEVAAPVPVPGQKPAHTYETFKKNFPQVMMSLIQDKKIDHKYLADLKVHYELKGEIFEIVKDDEKCRNLFDFFSGPSTNFITRLT